MHHENILEETIREVIIPIFNLTFLPFRHQNFIVDETKQLNNFPIIVLPISGRTMRVFLVYLVKGLSYKEVIM